MLIFEKLRYKNFLSTGDVFTEINLTEHKMNLISGKNGGGKSTILDAIIFALYGKPYRKISKKTLLINSINNKNMVVELEMSVGPNKFKIIRGEKPKIFEIYQNEVLRAQDAQAKDYQAFIEEDLIKANYKTLTQIVILGSANYTPFMELEAADRRKVIEDILDIGIFSQMSSGPLKEDMDENKELIRTLQAKMDVAQTKIDMVKQHNEKIKSRSTYDPSGELEQIDETENVISKLETRREKILEYIDNLTKPDENEKTSLDEKVNKRKELKYEISSNKKFLEKELSFMQENTTCPTCKQEISEGFRNHVICNNKNMLEEIETGEEKLQKQISKYEERINEIKKIDSEYLEAQRELRDTDYQIKSAKEKIVMLQSNIEKMKLNMNESLDLEDDSVYKDELNSLMDQYNDVMFQKEVLLEVSKMLKDDGAKSDVIKRYIPRMNKIINDYLIEFDLYVNFVLDENFDEKILSRYRDNFSYKSFSQGEKLRINLAIMLAWKEIAKEKNAISTNLLILDETLDGALDDAGVSDLIKALRNLEGERNNVFVISHRGDGLKDLFDHHIHFSKHKNFSIMETLS